MNEFSLLPHVYNQVVDDLKSYNLYACSVLIASICLFTLSGFYKTLIEIYLVISHLFLVYRYYDSLLFNERLYDFLLADNTYV